MDNDYLWDKIGSDAEIERLENALQAFAHRQAAAPALPAENAPVRRSNASRKLIFGFAAACLMLAALAFGVAWQIPPTESAAKQDSAQPNELLGEMAAIESNAESPTISDRAKSQNEKPNRKNANVRTAPPTTKRKIALRHSAPLVFGDSIAANTKSGKQNFKPAPAPLTAKEKRAYDQLVLALLITGEKLKIVKDKVEGLE